LSVPWQQLGIEKGLHARGDVARTPGSRKIHGYSLGSLGAGLTSWRNAKHIRRQATMSEYQTNM
jgi:hypothetical protein